MESFLEEPRTLPPKPTPVIQEIQATTVPEVSLMFQNPRKDTCLPVNYERNGQSYNAWKLRKNSNNMQKYDSFLLANKENSAIDRSMLLKKQVRFESPNAKPPLSGNYLKMPSKVNTETYKEPPQTVIKPIEKLYLSSLPNRELDLSFLEPQKNPCKNQKYQMPIKIHENNDYKSNSPKIEKDLSKKSIPETIQAPKCDENTKKVDEIVTTNTEDKKTNETVTVSDLLSIIKLQNEQLQKLQTQVEKLVKLNEEKLETDKLAQEKENQAVMFKEQQVGTTFHENLIPNHEQHKKISVGLMTSFEVSLKPPALKKKHKKVVHEYKNVFPQKYQQEKQDSYLNYRTTNETEYSLDSPEEIEIQEPPESPENSIHIDMQEYDTDSSDNECSTEEGWTFYQGILGQVNHLLKNSCPNYKPHKKHNDEYTDTTLEQIKVATMKRLQDKGFLQSNDNDQFQMKPTEVSFAVKQILMKYLPDDGLTDVVKNREECVGERRKPAFKFMQQCNVVTNTPQYYGATNKPIIKNPGTKPKNPKILDITTLKQQPKFL